MGHSRHLPACALLVLLTITQAQVSLTQTTATPATPAATAPPSAIRSTTTPTSSPVPSPSPRPSPSPAARTAAPAPPVAASTTAASTTPPATTTPPAARATTPPASPAAVRAPLATAPPARVPPVATLPPPVTAAAVRSPAASPTPRTATASTATAPRTAAILVNNPPPAVAANPPPAVVANPPPQTIPAAGNAPSPPPAPLSPPPSPPAPPGYTSVQSVLRVAGPNVTPFNTAKQTVLILALGSIMTTVTVQQIGIILVEAATSPSRRRLLSELDLGSAYGTFMGEGRKLLQSSDELYADPEATTLRNVVDVTLQFNSSSTTATGPIIAEVRSITGTSGSLQAALQAQGESSWGVTLLSAEASQPSGRLRAATVCRQKWAGLCLDGSGLSSAGVKGIIAAGVIVVVGAVTGLCVWWDVRRRSSRMGELEFAPDSPWHQTPMARYLGSLTGGRVGTPRAKHAKGRGGVQMNAHAGDHTPGGVSTPASSAATVSPQAGPRGPVV